MKSRNILRSSLPPWAGLLSCLLLALAAGGLHAQRLVTDRVNYLPGEPIRISFSGGPGNTKDWVGIYPEGATPGSVGSTLWFYVDGTRSGRTGLREGTLNFASGLNLAGVWNAYFLLNDGYDILTNAVFNVVDPSTPLVRPDRRTYAPREPITVAFTNGPANPKDWVAVYRAGQTPGSVGSTLWFYVDGTRSGTTGLPSGSVTFSAGLASEGEWVVYLLENDGYTVLASEPITVATPLVTGPRLVSITPANNSSNSVADAPYMGVITNGPAASVNPASVVLSLDGVPVAPSVVATNNQVTVTYTNGALLSPLSSHVYVLSFNDTATTPAAYRYTNAFAVIAYRDIMLPAPIVFEDFDAVPEGEVPTGWARTSFTEVQNTDVDFGNLDSAAYANWTVANAARFDGTFVTYSSPETPASEATDYQRVNLPNPANVLNGRVLREPLARGRFLFGNSGYRRGASQVIFIETPDYDLSGRTNVHVAFRSLWEQNQDSVAAAEYSVDGGTNWMPVAYFLDGPDIVRTPEGAVDVEATFNTERGDIARYTDPVSGAQLGGTYGAFIAAPITSALAPFIQARVNDDPVESKRYEMYPLPMADNRSRVRLRLAHAGTDSWYWGIDDFGLYAVGPTVVQRPVIAFERVAGGVRVSWTGGEGFVLESASGLDGIWTAVPGVTGNSTTVAVDAAMRVFRLRRP